MQSQAKSVEEYIQELPEERRAAVQKLRDTIAKKLPSGFEERMIYGMIGWVVPHSLYPEGYHAEPELPLPFLNLASQRNYIALYHMGIYTDKELLDWFTKEYPNHSKVKLNMGKSCIRFKKPEHIPYELIGELVSKMSPEGWIELYEKSRKR